MDVRYTEKWNHGVVFYGVFGSILYQVVSTIQLIRYSAEQN